MLHAHPRLFGLFQKMNSPKLDFRFTEFSEVRACTRLHSAPFPYHRGKGTKGAMMPEQLDYMLVSLRDKIPGEIEGRSNPMDQPQRRRSSGSSRWSANGSLRPSPLTGRHGRARHGPRSNGMSRAHIWCSARGWRCPRHPTPSRSWDATGANGTYFQLYSEERGVCRLYEMSIGDGEWKLWREGEPFPQRFSATISDDGNTIAGRWEKAQEGGRWETDFDLTYRKAR